MKPRTNPFPLLETLSGNGELFETISSFLHTTDVTKLKGSCKALNTFHNELEATEHKQLPKVIPIDKPLSPVALRQAILAETKKTPEELKSFLHKLMQLKKIGRMRGASCFTEACEFKNHNILHVLGWMDLSDFLYIQILVTLCDYNINHRDDYNNTGLDCLIESYNGVWMRDYNEKNSSIIRFVLAHSTLSAETASSALSKALYNANVPLSDKEGNLTLYDFTHKIKFDLNYRSQSQKTMLHYAILGRCDRHARLNPDPEADIKEILEFLSQIGLRAEHFELKDMEGKRPIDCTKDLAIKLIIDDFYNKLKSENKRLGFQR